MAAPRDLEEFCRVHQGRLVGLLSLYCGDARLAEELAQDAIVRLCAHWGSVRKMEHPAAWLHRVGMNGANSYFRRKSAERRASTRLPKQSEAVRDPDRADSLAVRKSVAALPSRQRTALVLRYYADLPLVEIADAMGTSVGTVKSLLHRAVKQLRSQPELALLKEDQDAPRPT